MADDPDDWTPDERAVFADAKRALEDTAWPRPFVGVAPTRILHHVARALHYAGALHGFAPVDVVRERIECGRRTIGSMQLAERDSGALWREAICDLADPLVWVPMALRAADPMNSTGCRHLRLRHLEAGGVECMDCGRLVGR